jgi:hypothetical protein
MNDDNRFFLKKSSADFDRKPNLNTSTARPREFLEDNADYQLIQSACRIDDRDRSALNYSSAFPNQRMRST